ncbi:beta-L-arabinofuranosidase domain-containing protein [Gaoshiqia sediminis]|uniref:Glycoside hydrolase family 127 protein n=1 Tax=Gaoshiqia sediminis TaxID=2986998 RepID=A0AA41Y4K1_9BACT|nr:beta-L-arabinofuranosidase domain-containing protein [Gaoshiqia sediminis]MCW0481406.1 glycoside hydrolase family 127 protein [Gaoshiqia sediminis]
MIRTPILLTLVAFSLFSSCRYRTAPEPTETSKALKDEQIALGGIIAEQLTDYSLINSSLANREAVFAESLQHLRALSEEMKYEKTGEEAENEFRRAWTKQQEKITRQLENLSIDDARNWIALNDSLLKYSGEVVYADELERMAYNIAVPEIMTESMIKSFCYTNLYDRIYVNFFSSSYMEYEHTTGGKVRIIQDTNYPFDGSIVLKIELQDTRYLDLFVRIPHWADRASVTVKGVKYNVIPGTYTEIAKKWKNGDEMEIVLGMRPDTVSNGQGNFAFTYGPLLLAYSDMQNDSLVFSGTDPVKYLRYVSPPGKMPTFTFSGIPQKTLVLQPYFSEEQEGRTRTAWIKTL